jgi:hypothetical protein
VREVSRRRAVDEPPLRYEWERVIKALPLPSSAKHVALNAATYADNKGGGVYPGNERTVADTGLSLATVKRAYKLLRDVGLLDRIVEASRVGKRGIADEYRLAIPDDVLERVVNYGPGLTVSRGSDLTRAHSEPWSTGDQGSHRADQGSHRAEPGLTVSSQQPIEQPIEQTRGTVLDVSTERARARPRDGRRQP